MAHVAYGCMPRHSPRSAQFTAMIGGTNRLRVNHQAMVRYRVCRTAKMLRRAVRMRTSLTVKSGTRRSCCLPLITSSQPVWGVWRTPGCAARSEHP